MAKKKKKGVKALTKAQLKEYNALKQRASRAGRKAWEANKGFDYGKVRGKRNKYRTKRTEAYKERTEANKLLLAFNKKHGIGKVKPLKKQKEKVNVKTRIVDFATTPAFQFEKDLAKFIKSKSINKIVFPDTKESVSGKDNPSKIFSIYDRNRNTAYKRALSRSVFVNPTIDYNTMTLYLTFIS